MGTKLGGNPDMLCKTHEHQPHFKGSPETKSKQFYLLWLCFYCKWLGHFFSFVLSNVIFYCDSYCISLRVELIDIIHLIQSTSLFAIWKSCSMMSMCKKFDSHSQIPTVVIAQNSRRYTYWQHWHALLLFLFTIFLEDMKSTRYMHLLI